MKESAKQVLESPKADGIKLNGEKATTPFTNSESPPNKTRAENNVEGKGKKLDYDLKEPQLQHTDVDHEQAKSKNAAEPPEKPKAESSSASHVPNPNQMEVKENAKESKVRLQLDGLNVPAGRVDVKSFSKTPADYNRTKSAVFLKEALTPKEKTLSFMFPESSDKKSENKEEAKQEKCPDKEDNVSAVDIKLDIVLPHEDHESGKGKKKQGDSNSSQTKDKKLDDSKQSNSVVNAEEEINKINTNPFSTISNYKMQDKVAAQKTNSKVPVNGLDDSPLPSPDTSPKTAVQVVPKMAATDSNWRAKKAADKGKLKLSGNLLEESVILDTSNVHGSDKLLSESMLKLLQADLSDDVDSRSVKDTYSLPHSGRSSGPDFHVEVPSPNNLLSTTDMDNVEECLMVLF